MADRTRVAFIIFPNSLLSLDGFFMYKTKQAIQTKKYFGQLEERRYVAPWNNLKH
jgi:hypothetical protein